MGEEKQEDMVTVVLDGMTRYGYDNWSQSDLDLDDETCRRVSADVLRTVEELIMKGLMTSDGKCIPAVPAPFVPRPVPTFFRGIKRIPAN